MDQILTLKQVILFLAYVSKNKLIFLQLLLSQIKELGKSFFWGGGGGAGFYVLLYLHNLILMQTWLRRWVTLVGCCGYIIQR